MSDMQPIRIRCTEGWRDANAYVFGEWAAHLAPSKNGRLYWAVTHVTTGLALPQSSVGALEPRFALALAERLATAVPVVRVVVADGTSVHADDAAAILRIIGEVCR